MTLVLCGGGTAGHCLPCIALLPKLRETFNRIIYVGGEMGVERDIAENAGLEYFGVTTVKFRRALTVKNLAIPFKLLRGVRESKHLLQQIHPVMVFSKGGYAALPVALAAAALKIPIVSHESDLTMGMANKMTAKKSAVLCTTFPQTADKHKNAVHTGAIIRAELYHGDKNKITGFSGDKPNLLVVGGSSGAAVLNRAIWDAIDTLLLHYNVLHIAGRGKDNPDIKKYNYVQLQYVDAPQDAFAWADVVISRAGSGTLCELLALRKPTIFVPLPKNESRGDQIENANYMSRLGCCHVLNQEYLTAENLLKAIAHALDNRELMIANCEKLTWLDGTDKVAKIIVDTLQ